MATGYILVALITTCKMSNYNKTFAIISFVCMLAFSSCMEQKILFRFNRDVNKDFFKAMPGIGDNKYADSAISKPAKQIQLYRSSFREKYVEKDNLLELTELNDSSEINDARYMNVKGYSQDLYLLKYEFAYTENDIPVSAAIYFSVKHNGRGETIGITPCYFGIINNKKNLIAFTTNLSVVKEKDTFYLKPLPGSRNKRDLIFMPANFPAEPVALKSTFNIKKIVRLDANKIGGNKPLVIDINSIFKDSNALQFHYFKSINLTQ
jgi:hypothetical protein